MAHPKQKKSGLCGISSVEDTAQAGQNKDRITGLVLQVECVVRMGQIYFVCQHFGPYTHMV